MDKHIRGAKWWRFDFHNHTPKSLDFGKGQESEKNLKASDWLQEFMDKEIDCVAVTDHNTGAWIDELKSTYATMKASGEGNFRELTIFPGVEISVNGGIHVLAILDVDKTSEDVSNLIGACGYLGTSGDSDGVTSESLEKVLDLITKKGGIAIPAHVDKGAGLFDRLSGITLQQALKGNRDNLLAIELIDDNYSLPEVYLQSKLKLAQVIGSDGHTKADLGKNFTWVKMGKPSLDALRLALHDGEDSIVRKSQSLQNPNNVKHRYFIKSLHVKDGFRLGNGSPLKTEYSPWLTSIIGGRGSGKSTVLNFLRIALNRIDEMPHEIQADFDEFNRIGSKTSSGMLRDNTNITLEVIKDGKPHKIEWKEGKHFLTSWDNNSSTWDEPVEVTNIGELFPIQIFSQKELYSLTKDPSKLIELIDSQFDEQSWLEEKSKLTAKWIEKRGEYRDLKKAIDNEKNLKVQLSATNDRIKIYESSEYKTTLENYNKLKATKNFFADTEAKTKDLISDLESLQKHPSEIKIPDEINESLDDSSKELVEKLSDAIGNAKEKIRSALVDLTPYKEDLGEMFNAFPWYQQFLEAEQEYQSIVNKMNELGSETYEELLTRRKLFTEKLGLIEAQKTKLDELGSTLDQLYDSIIQLEMDLRVKRRAVINQWKASNTGQSPFLIIDLLPMHDAEQATRSFRKLIRKEGNEFAGYIYDINDSDGSTRGLISDLLTSTEDDIWSKRKDLVENFVSITESDRKGYDTRLARHVEWLRENTAEDLDRLLVWVPEDKLILKFKKDGKEHDIQTGSAGERTAGMLGLLLALNEVPLIIDQPEDDLDTSLISNFVVQGFKALKQKRQLILVTHNPNIAVNANSDNIIHMNYQSGQIVVSGNDALQEKSIRTAVCSVMEGGREALDKRYYRISLALN